MSNQEEIRNEIAREFYVFKALAGDMPWSQAWAARTVMVDLAYAKADEVLAYLDSVGGCLKADRELPERVLTVLFRYRLHGEERMSELKRLLKDEAGYEAVEPLLEAR